MRPCPPAHVTRCLCCVVAALHAAAGEGAASRAWRGRRSTAGTRRVRSAEGGVFCITREGECMRSLYSPSFLLLRACLPLLAPSGVGCPSPEPLRPRVDRKPAAGAQGRAAASMADMVMDVEETMELAPACPIGVAETLPPVPPVSHARQHFADSLFAASRRADDRCRGHAEEGFAVSGGPASGGMPLPPPGFSEAEYLSVHRNHPLLAGGQPQPCVHEWQMGDREPGMQQEGDQWRVASPCHGSSMPRIEDLPRPPSPPPSGTTYDADLERAPTMPSCFPPAADESMVADRCVDSSRERSSRHLIQLSHWKTLLAKQPNDGLAFFWREQVKILEAHLLRQQRAGSKRSAEFEDGTEGSSTKRERFCRCT